MSTTTSSPAKRRIRVPLLAVFCALFVIAMIGYMWIDSIESDISRLKVTVADFSSNSECLTREYKAVTTELAHADADEYIVAKARQLYGYIMPNELLFVVKNPEVLGTSVGDEAQLYVIEGDTF